MFISFESLMDEVFGSENFVSQITLRQTRLGTRDFLAGAATRPLVSQKSEIDAKYRPLYSES